MGNKDILRPGVHPFHSRTKRETVPELYLYWAAKLGQKDFAEQLIALGADVNLGDKRKYTPLHEATIKGHRDIAALLIDNGANVHSRTIWGWSPLHEAASHGRKEIASLLIHKGADIEAKNNDGKSPLALAARHGRKDVAALLLENGADVHVADNNKYTPLHRAIIKGHRDIVALLINNGDDETESEEEKSPTKKKRGRPKAVTSVNTAADYDESDDEEMLGPEDDDNKLYHACLPLTRGDDTHWLSELTCFVRKDMVEFFSAKKEDVELEDEEIVEGQVGVRCAFCARADPDDRPDGYSYFPKSLADIYQKVSDLQRRHFFKCSEVTADAKKSLTSLGGFASKAEAETHQFWVDSARELGITNYDIRDGLRFYRGPSKTSYADDITKERAKVRKNAVIDKKDLVRPTDVCTDEMYLLLKQVRPCRFKNSDRRVGPGSRGRDRALGFPGLACKHCPSKNTTGRFFPMTSKNLDNTINAMQGHVTSCSRCPESVKSGIAYLSHRSTLQKADLGTAWKKTFCKDVWDRLHVERAWSSNKDVTVPMEKQESVEHEEPKVEENSEEVDEMVKAAAQWLTKRDNQAESANGSKPRASRGRGLPSRKRRDSNDGAP